MIPVNIGVICHLIGVKLLVVKMCAKYAILMREVEGRLTYHRNIVCEPKTG